MAFISQHQPESTTCLPRNCFSLEVIQQPRFKLFHYLFIAQHPSLPLHQQLAYHSSPQQLWLIFTSLSQSQPQPQPYSCCTFISQLFQSYPHSFTRSSSLHHLSGCLLLETSEMIPFQSSYQDLLTLKPTTCYIHQSIFNFRMLQTIPF